jgi:hypothetical protein
MFANHHGVLVLALCSCAALANPVQAGGEGQSEFVPELNAYWSFSDRFRLFVAASAIQSLGEGVSDGDLGAYLDVLSIKAIFPGRLLDIDWARNRYVWARVGYAFGGIHEGVRLRDGYSETQFVTEMSGRYPISPTFWAMTRARLEVRTLSGDRSNRYRFRVGVDAEYTVLGRAAVPYAHAELLYDTRFDAWNRQIYEVGIDIELTQSLHIEPSYAFQIDTAVEPAHVNRLGLSLKYYR